MPCVLECFSYFYFILFFKDLIYFWRGGRRERGRETSMCSCILPPNEVWEPGPQPRPGPRPGIKPATLRSAGLQAGTQSTHRDTPARGFPLFSRRSVDRGQTGHEQRVEGEESRRRVQKRQRCTHVSAGLAPVLPLCGDSVGKSSLNPQGSLTRKMGAAVPLRSSLRIPAGQ